MTIIVLLILAGTTIATLFGENGIIKMAERAQEETEKQLQNLMNELSNTIGDNIEGPTEWTQNEDGSITDGKGNTIKIGDYVEYSCKSSTATYTSPASRSGYTGDQVFRANAYNYGWRVLGVDKETKQLQLISEDFVPLTGRRR